MVKRDKLGRAADDEIALAVSGVASFIPFAGSVLQDIAKSALSSRTARGERCVAFLLEALVRNGLLPQSVKPSAEELQSIGFDPSDFDTLCEAAAASKSDEALERIAHILANGIGNEPADRHFARRLARIASRISNGSIIVLGRMHPENASSEAYYEANRQVLDGRSIHPESPAAELAAHNLYMSYLYELQSEGLVQSARGFGISRDAEASWEITHLGAELLRRTGAVQSNSTLPLELTKFAVRVLEVAEAINDSAQSVDLHLDPLGYRFLGYHPTLETHFNEYCGSLFDNDRWPSQRPSLESQDVARQIGKMAPIYSAILENFSDFDEKTDYRSQPLEAETIVKIIAPQVDALAKLGFDLEN